MNSNNQIQNIEEKLKIYYLTCLKDPKLIFEETKLLQTYGDVIIDYIENNNLNRDILVWCNVLIARINNIECEIFQQKISILVDLKKSVLWLKPCDTVYKSIDTKITIPGVIIKQYWNILSYKICISNFFKGLQQNEKFNEEQYKLIIKYTDTQYVLNSMF